MGPGWGAHQRVLPGEEKEEEEEEEEASSSKFPLGAARSSGACGGHVFQAFAAALAVTPVFVRSFAECWNDFSGYVKEFGGVLVFECPVSSQCAGTGFYGTAPIPYLSVKYNKSTCGEATFCGTCLRTRVWCGWRRHCAQFLGKLFSPVVLQRQVPELVRTVVFTVEMPQLQLSASFDIPVVALVQIPTVQLFGTVFGQGS